MTAGQDRAERPERERPSAPPLTATEQRIGFALTAVAVGTFAALRHDQPIRLAIGLAVAAVLAFAATRRARIGTAAASFLTAFGGPWGYLAIAGAAYAGYALWLLSRAAKVAADLTEPGPTAGT